MGFLYFLWIIISVAITSYCIANDEKYGWIAAPALVSAVIGLCCWLSDACEVIV